MSDDDRGADTWEPEGLGAYILEGTAFRLAKTRDEWCRHMENAEGNRQIAYDYDADSETSVSTIFLGVDHNFGIPKGPPLLFESMLFFNDPKREDEQQRYHSYQEAKLGHQEMLAELKKHNAQRTVQTEQAETGDE